MSTVKHPPASATSHSDDQGDGDLEGIGHWALFAEDERA